MSRLNFAFASACLLSACATRPAEKPIITAKIVDRIGRQCDAVESRIHFAANALPYASFVLKSADGSEEQASPPSFACIGKAIAAYRYDVYGYRLAHEARR